jgi:hypothetical protein
MYTSTSITFDSPAWRDTTRYCRLTAVPSKAGPCSAQTKDVSAALGGIGPYTFAANQSRTRPASSPTANETHADSAIVLQMIPVQFAILDTLHLLLIRALYLWHL